MLCTRNIFAQESGRWSTVFENGNGIDGQVYALTFGSDGELYVGGFFSEAGGIPANNIAIWTGTEWKAMGAGFDRSVYDIAIDDDGVVYAGGSFTVSDTVRVNGLAKWDGTAWQPLGTGVFKETDLGRPFPFIETIAIDREGALYIGGDFTEVDGVPARGIARWDGTMWSSPGGGMGIGGGCVDLTLDNVFVITIDSSNTVYAGGDFIEVGGLMANGVAGWDGTSWFVMGSGTEDVSYCSNIRSMVLYQNELYVGGSFGVMSDTENTRGIAKWNGSSWHTVGGGFTDGGVFDMAISKSGIFMVGRFSQAGNKTVNNIAKWTQNDWLSLGDGITSAIAAYSVAANDNGDVYVGGFQLEAGGSTPQGLLHWESSQSVSTDNGPDPPQNELQFDIYPNPFNDQLTIDYFSPTGHVPTQLDVYNLSGQRVATLIDVIAAPGRQQITWDARPMPDGIYILRLRTNSAEISRMVHKISGIH